MPPEKQSGNASLLSIVFTAVLVAAFFIAAYWYVEAQDSRKRAKELNDMLWAANQSVTRLSDELRREREDLNRERERREEAETESQERLRIIFSQQQNINSLTSCLRGVIEAIDQAGNNEDEAVEATLERIEEPCRASASLF